MKNGTRYYINITNKCNTNCPFCCMYSSTDNNRYMTFETFKCILDEGRGPFELQLEGGEPLLAPNLYLFIEYAISTGRCSKVIILTNGICLEKHLKRLVDLHKWYDIPFEIKVSVNYWLIQQNKDHIKMISDLVFCTEFIPNFNIILNTRKREMMNGLMKKLTNMKILKISTIVSIFSLMVN